jgi:flagellin
MGATRVLASTNEKVGKNIKKLSSGYRINQAADDAAGLAISEKMRAQVRGLDRAGENVQDAISLIQTADGALQESQNVLHRMRELAVQSASDTNEQQIDRAALQAEFEQLLAEVDDTANKTVYNNAPLLTGDFSEKRVTAFATSKPAAGAPQNAGEVVVAWADYKVQPGKYEMSTFTQLKESEVVAHTEKSIQTQPTIMTSKDGQVTATWVPGDVDAERLNGVWNFSIEGSEAIAINAQTGERINKQLISIPAADPDPQVGELDFSPLGKLLITNSNTNPVESDSFTGFVGQVQVAGVVDAKPAKYDHIAMLGNDQTVLETGMTALNFPNTGISVKLKDSLAINEKSNISGLNPAEINVETVNGNGLIVQSGANEGDNVSLSIRQMDAYSLGVALANIRSREDASVAITQCNSAINSISTQRGALGAMSNRFEHKVANLAVSSESLRAAESRIRDVDMAKESTELAKNQILSNAGTAMVSQANSIPQGVLQILQ